MDPDNELAEAIRNSQRTAFELGCVTARIAEGVSESEFGAFIAAQVDRHYPAVCKSQEAK